MISRSQILKIFGSSAQGAVDEIRSEYSDELREKIEEITD